MPAAVSTCGANTTAGFVSAIVLVTSSIGAGANGACAPLPDAARFQHDGVGGDRAHVEDLRPAVAEPAVANDEATLAAGELTRDRFHAEGAAARDDDLRTSAPYTSFSVAEMSRITPWNLRDMWLSARSV